MCNHSVNDTPHDGLNGYKVITLCGSTKFKEEFMKVQKELTLKGNIVISVGCFNHAGDDLSESDGKRTRIIKGYFNRMN